MIRSNPSPEGMRQRPPPALKLPAALRFDIAPKQARAAGVTGIAQGREGNLLELIQPTR